ncbi:MULTISPECIES: signal peptidase I [unclassified Rathayibacter]|uniref:signal peptidase I n=2 Tax=unclassified Rathayibacter TaxID=2609250 RepID=UPI000CE8DEEB|nr:MULTISPECIES: signal peptidase I [unclassified Rathayibacter]PPH16174.1 signal peptidase I [Rathayibacter sp. AY1F8]PPH71291.1 signal peptidase I [Rathayibacter sp. AY1D4]PPH87244.1 signal peptidase I [Rathayibacter sp. AY1D3]
MTTPAESVPLTSPRPPQRRRHGALLFLRDVVVIVLVAVLVSSLVKTFLVRSFYIPSSSMNNTLVQDDRIIVNELVPDVVPLSRGDVIVFKDPGGWLQPVPQAEDTSIAWLFENTLQAVGLAPEETNDHLIKRLIGLPGDHVVCCTPLGQMTVNGQPLDEASYIKDGENAPAASSIPFDVTVPADGLWVMGDNRENSADSRLQQGTPSKGFVPIDNVTGRAVAITWPIDRWRWLDNFPNTFQGLDPR